MIKLEKAFVKYNKGEYDYTINSEYIDFENIKDAKEYIYNNLEEDIEYYLYEDEAAIEDNNSIFNIICNDILKELNSEYKIIKNFKNTAKTEIVLATNDIDEILDFYKKDNTLDILNFEDIKEMAEELEITILDLLKNYFEYYTEEDVEEIKNGDKNVLYAVNNSTGASDMKLIDCEYEEELRDIIKIFGEITTPTGIKTEFEFDYKKI